MNFPLFIEDAINFSDFTMSYIYNNFLLPTRFYADLESLKPVFLSAKRNYYYFYQNPNSILISGSAARSVCHDRHAGPDLLSVQHLQLQYLD